ncbi:MAG: M23 family metallopeptidase [Planctomycetes bacterium]|nr:M23 family metallopeptidase [Planctomycetota bacterium]
MTAPHNVIGIRHDDNTLAQYLHLRKNGARVKKGQRVAQGEVIGESGNVGYSTSPHLHFEVTRYIDKRWVTIPVTFADVPGDGIPRAWRRYTSGG